MVSSAIRSRSSLLPSVPTGVSRDTVSREMVSRLRTWSTGSAITSAISAGVGSRPSLGTNRRVAVMSLLNSSVACTGMRMVRAWSVAARAMLWRIHHEAYVESL